MGPPGVWRDGRTCVPGFLMTTGAPGREEHKEFMKIALCIYAQPVAWGPVYHRFPFFPGRAICFSRVWPEVAQL